MNDTDRLRDTVDRFSAFIQALPHALAAQPPEAESK